MHGRPEPRFDSKRLPRDMRILSVIGTDLVCEVDKKPTANVLPNISIKFTQYIRLARMWRDCLLEAIGGRADRRDHDAGAGG